MWTNLFLVNKSTPCAQIFSLWANLFNVNKSIYCKQIYLLCTNLFFVSKYIFIVNKSNSCEQNNSLYYCKQIYSLRANIFIVRKYIFCEKNLFLVNKSIPCEQIYSLRANIFIVNKSINCKKISFFWAIVLAIIPPSLYLVWDGNLERFYLLKFFFGFEIIPLYILILLFGTNKLLKQQIIQVFKNWNPDLLIIIKYLEFKLNY